MGKYYNGKLKYIEETKSLHFSLLHQLFLVAAALLDKYKKVPCKSGSSV